MRKPKYLFSLPSQDQEASNIKETDVKRKSRKQKNGQLFKQTTVEGGDLIDIRASQPRVKHHDHHHQPPSNLKPSASESQLKNLHHNHPNRSNQEYMIKQRAATARIRSTSNTQNQQSRSTSRRDSQNSALRRVCRRESQISA